MRAWAQEQSTEQVAREMIATALGVPLDSVKVTRVRPARRRPWRIHRTVRVQWAVIWAAAALHLALWVFLISWVVAP